MDTQTTYGPYAHAQSRIQREALAHLYRRLRGCKAEQVYDHGPNKLPMSYGTWRRTRCYLYGDRSGAIMAETPWGWTGIETDGYTHQ